MPARVELFLVPGGYAGINPIEGNRANVCLLMTYKAFEQAGKSVPATIAAVAERHPRLARRLAMARPVEGTVCAVAPVDTGRAAQPFWDGVACLGDTASMIAPLCGDGMAMALRSAELCVPSADAFLRGSLSLAGWAENYSQAWRAEFAGRVRLGRLLQSLLTTPLASEALVHLGRQRPALVEYLLWSSIWSGLHGAARRRLCRSTWGEAGETTPFARNSRAGVVSSSVSQWSDGLFAGGGRGGAAVQKHFAPFTSSPAGQ
jgi:flavin-dependent dehydrogenase